MPVWRQNALMIMSPPEYSNSLVSLVSDLDKPGRQVMLKAVIAEISLDDSTALGLRFDPPANRSGRLPVCCRCCSSPG